MVHDFTPECRPAVQDDPQGSRFVTEIYQITRACGMDVIAAQEKLEKLWIRVRNSVIHKRQVCYLNSFADALRSTPALTTLATRLEKNVNFLLGVHAGQDKKERYIPDKNPMHHIVFLDADGAFKFCLDDPSQALRAIRASGKYPTLTTMQIGRALKDASDAGKRKACQEKAACTKEKIDASFKDCATTLDALSAERLLRATITAYAKLPYDLKSEYGKKICELHGLLIRQEFADLDKEAQIRGSIEEKTSIAL